jgi:hypothetical protein
MSVHPPPADFDWVAARISCSIEKVFASLREQAQRNVETIKAANPHAKFEFTSFDGGFSIAREERPLGSKRGVVFSFYPGTKNEISVDSMVDKTVLTVTATRLNNLGQCLLVVNDEELEQWQLLRRDLEPLFFRSGS